MTDPEFYDAGKVDELLAGKQDKLSQSQLAAVNSGATKEKIDAIDEKLDKSDVIDPATATTTGKAADAKKVAEALEGKAPANIIPYGNKIRIADGDNVWWIMPGSIYYWNDGEAGEWAHSPIAIFALPTSIHDSSFALLSDIADATKLTPVRDSSGETVGYKLGAKTAESDPTLNGMTAAQITTLAEAAIKDKAMPTEGAAEGSVAARIVALEAGGGGGDMTFVLKYNAEKDVIYFDDGVNA